eukprot:UN21727
MCETGIAYLSLGILGLVVGFPVLFFDFLCDEASIVRPILGSVSLTFIFLPLSHLQPCFICP